jgi:hypothetical protein
MPYLRVWVSDTVLNQMNYEASFSKPSSLLEPKHLTQDNYQNYDKTLSRLNSEPDAVINKINEENRYLDNSPVGKAKRRANQVKKRAAYKASNKKRKERQDYNVANTENFFKRQALRGTYAAENLGTTIARNPIKSALAGAAILGGGSYLRYTSTGPRTISSIS